MAVLLTTGIRVRLIFGGEEYAQGGLSYVLVAFAILMPWAACRFGGAELIRKYEVSIDSDGLWSTPNSPPPKDTTRSFRKVKLELSCPVEFRRRRMVYPSCRLG
ncbi:MAG: hypothetical protein ACI8XO_000639 [Verrucomicrobiales bacterium]|jgi:hypothetical protein